MNKAIITILSIIIVLMITAGVVFFIYFPLPDIKAAVKEKQGVLFNTGSSFVTNLKDSSYLLKSDIYIEVDDKKTLEAFDENSAKICYNKSLMKEEF